MRSSRTIAAAIPSSRKSGWPSAPPAAVWRRAFSSSVCSCLTIISSLATAVLDDSAASLVTASILRLNASMCFLLSSSCCCRLAFSFCRAISSWLAAGCSLAASAFSCRAISALPGFGPVFVAVSASGCFFARPASPAASAFLLAAATAGAEATPSTCSPTLIFLL